MHFLVFAYESEVVPEDATTAIVMFFFFRQVNFFVSKKDAIAN